MAATTRVLLVEDNGGDARLVREYLDPPNAPVPFGAPRPGWTQNQGSASGYRVHHVSSLSEALSALLAERFDVMLLDLDLPDSPRPETVEALRNFGGGLAIVILSGMDDLLAAYEALEHGFQDYLVKAQIDEQSLRRAIRHAVSRHQAQQSLREDAVRDPVTGLHNIRGFMLAGARQLVATERAGEPCMVLAIRVRGSHEPDSPQARAVFAWVGRALEQIFDAGDVLARVGEQVVAACAAPCDEERAATLVTELERRLLAWSADPAWPGPLNVSVGAAPARLGSTVEALLDEALTTALSRHQHESDAREAA